MFDTFESALWHFLIFGDAIYQAADRSPSFWFSVFCDASLITTAHLQPADVAISSKLDAISSPTGITHKHPCPTCGQAVYSEAVERLFSATEKCIDAGDTDAARANLDTLRAQLGDDDLKVIGLEVVLRFTEDPSGDF